MILSKEIIINVTNRNISHYKRIGLNPVVGSIKIKVDDLPKCSRTRIDVKCDICGEIKNISYQKYNENISRWGYYTCSQLCSKGKVKKTNNEKYGTDYPLQSFIKKEELKQYFIEKYGVDNTSKLEEVKKKREKTMYERFGVKVNFILPEVHKKAIECSLTKESKEKRMKTCWEKYGYNCHNSYPDMETKKKKNIEFEEYKRKVINITRSNIKNLFLYWNGKDFYDNEYINENFNLLPNDRNYPTIDHKTSIFHGFNNKISPENIGNLSNLCITKRYINSRKNKNNNIENISLL